jgi:hypothetical protein
MRRRKPLPVPQFEFGFTPGTFNLIQETGTDGERVAQERLEVARNREQAEAAQCRMFVKSNETVSKS